MVDPFSKFAPKNTPEWLKNSNKKIQEYNQQIKEAQSSRPAMTGRSIDSTPLSGQGPGVAEPNVLNKFASYVTIFTLSALSREELEDNTIMLGQPAHDVIAKSAGIGNDGNFTPFNNADEVARFSVGKDKEATVKRTEQQKAMLRNSSDILARGHDLFFERVMIRGSNSANSARKLMQYNEIEMDLHEPFGVTLFEKLRAAANNNKFRDHTDAPFLLTIEFRGFDDLGQPIGGKSITKRLLPIRINNAEMEINEGGTMYHIKASPWTEFAMFDRYLYTRGAGTLLDKAKDLIRPNRTEPASTLTEALRLLQNRLNDQQKDEVLQGVRNVADTYVIRTSIGPDTANQSQNWEVDSGEGSFRTTIGPNQSIAEIITRMVMRCDAFRDIVKIAKDYWNRRDLADRDLRGQVSDEDYYKYLGSEMIDWFKIKTTVYTSAESFDTIRKTEAKTIVYEVIPHKIHILNFTVPGLSGSKLWGKFTKKKYKYIYTGDNTEILDLKINYKVGFYLSSLVDGSGAQGILKDMQKELSKSKTTGITQRFASFASNYPELGLPIKSEPTMIKSVDANTGAGASMIAVEQFYDYLTNPLSDMVQVEMTIMGDPAFIGQENFLPIKQVKDADARSAGGNQSTQVASPGRGLLFDEQLGTFNFDQAECLITLDFRFPTDLDERQGVMNFKNREEIIFSGLYRVPVIESLWDKGKFTQTLTMARLNNQGEEVGTVSEIQIQEAKDAADKKAKLLDSIINTPQIDNQVP
jgi:hypothetical protein